MHMPTLNKRKDSPPSHRQGGNYRHIYQSARWHKLSLQFRKANPLCKRCKEKGLTEVSEVVDHIIPLVIWIPQGGDPFDTKNMQALSKSCHSVKTKEDKSKYKD
jgi:5-methylcytosine-specific restriction endonuclease McrA